MINFSLNTSQHLTTYSLIAHLMSIFDQTVLSTREIKQQAQSLQAQNLNWKCTESDDKDRKYDD